MRATRLPKLWLKALRTDSNTIANTPATIEGVTGQTAPQAEIVQGTAAARFAVNVKTIVDGSATGLFEVPVASGGMAGGFILFTVVASDGTDHQAISGIATYSGVNKAGTITATNAVYDSANETKSVSGGTLTLAFTSATATGKFTVKLQPTGSLTETLYQCSFLVIPTVGTVKLI